MAEGTDQGKGGHAFTQPDGKWPVIPLSHREDSEAEEDPERPGKITSYFSQGPQTCRPQAPHRYFQERGLEAASSLEEATCAPPAILTQE